MKYENKVLVFPMGMKANLNLDNQYCNHLLVKNSKIKLANRRKTLKIGNAIRLKDFKEDVIIDNCTLYFEGTLTENGIEPYVLHKCCVYVSSI